MPSTRRGPVLAGEPGDHAGVGRAGDRADDDRVEEDAELAPPARSTSYAQFANPSPPSGCSDAPAGIGVRRAAGLPRPRRSASSQDVLDADVEAGGSSRTSAPMIRDSRMLPTLSLTGSAQSTHFSCTSRPSGRAGRRPRPPAGCGWTGSRRSRPACRRPGPSTSGTMYSSLRVLLPPYASPVLQSSRLAQICAPPRCSVSRSSRCTGLGPNGQRVALEVVDGHGRVLPVDCRCGRPHRTAGGAFRSNLLHLGLVLGLVETDRAIDPDRG